MNFFQAFVISLLGHILCFFTFNIIVVPRGITAQTFTNVCFLGSILDNNAFTREIKRAYNAGEEEMKGAKERVLCDRKALFSKRIIKPQIKSDYLLTSKQVFSSIDEIMKVDKYVFDNLQTAEKPKTSESDVKIIGSAKERAILSKPAKPYMLEEGFIIKHGLNNGYFKVKLKVTISPEGRVRKVEKLTSSGYPEIDLIWMRYVGRWIFAPIDSSVSNHDQQGILELELRASNRL